MVFVTIFRFSNLISRGYLIIFTFIVPLILLLFRNSEFLSSLFGRSVTNEKYITFNLEKDSIFRTLRIMTFRKEIESMENISLNNTDEIISRIDSINKLENINLIIINFNQQTKIDKKLESYLIDINKKILIISRN